MQTFLPYPSFVASAIALDDRRLGKQRVETFQILRALVFPTYGWKNHPAVAMWRGFTPALVGYGLTVCREWERRGHADAVAGALLEFTAGAVPELSRLRAEGRLPPWLGTESVHISHRAALLRKDPAYYAELFGTDPDAPLAIPEDLPYDWPAPLFPRWPVRRSGALSVTDALTAARLDGDPEAAATVTAAVAALRDGAEVTVESAALALASVLALDSPALWLTSQPDVHLDTPPPHPPPPRLERPPGKLSPSIARLPSPADAAAMIEEAVADVGVIVHPRQRLTDPLVADRLAAQPPTVVVTPIADQPQSYAISRERHAVSRAAPAPSRRRTAGSPAGSTRRRPPRRRGTAGTS